MVNGELYREVWNQQWEEVERVLRVDDGVCGCLMYRTKRCLLDGAAAPIFRMNLTVFGELMLCFGEQYSRELSVVRIKCLTRSSWPAMSLDYISGSDARAFVMH